MSREDLEEFVLFTLASTALFSTVKFIMLALCTGPADAFIDVMFNLPLMIAGFALFYILYRLGMIPRAKHIEEKEVKNP